MGISVFFNPACSNCQTVRGILQAEGYDADYLRYLEQAPRREEIEVVLSKLGTDDPREIVRTKEPVYDELNLAAADRDQLLDAMVAHPILIQRPIVIKGDKAIIARPGERVRELLGS